MGDLGQYFDLIEFERSTSAARLGLDNSTSPAARMALSALVAEVLDPLRAAMGPIRITSGYRTHAVNEAIGGSNTSQHCKGEAADIKLVHEHNAQQLADAIAQLDLPVDHQLDLPVDQCIWYADDCGGHVHVSHTSIGNRHQFLHCYRDSQKRYSTYLPSKSRNA
jgi:hypothetical protein